MSNKITTHDILTGDFFDCEAYAFLNKWWDIETPKWPEHEFFNKLLNDIKEAEPKYFSLANFQCRRFKTNQLLASMNYEAINWLKKSTIYFKNDNSFWLVKKDNGIEKINQGEILISLELDWIAYDWRLAEEIKATWIFDTKPLKLTEIRNLPSSCFLCPNSETSDILVKPDEAEEVVIPGKYTIKYLQSPGKSRWERLFKETEWNTDHSNEKLDQPWRTQYWLQDSGGYGKTLANFLLPIKSEIAGDKNIKFNSNVFTEKKTTEHFLLRHGHYNVKLLGEEIGKVNGISNLNQEFKVLIRGSFYNWELAIVFRDKIFTNNFLISEAKGDKETANWLSTMGSTLMAAFQVAVAAKTANPIAIKAAAGSTLKAINNWSEALNEPKATVNIDEITNWLYSKANNNLIEIYPEVPYFYRKKYNDKVNWHIMNDYFPLSNDCAIALIPGIGWINGRAFQVFSKGNINGWVKLSEKCIVDCENNRAINFLKKNNVFIYSEPGTQPTKEFLHWEGGSVPFTWNISGGGITTHYKVPGELIEKVIKQEYTFVFLLVSYSGNFPPNESGGITINQDNSYGNPPIGRYYKFSYNNADKNTIIEWGKDNQDGTTYIKYPRGNTGEEVRMDKTNSQDYFRLRCFGDKWYVELIKKEADDKIINIPGNTIKPVKIPINNKIPTPTDISRENIPPNGGIKPGNSNTPPPPNLKMPIKPSPQENIPPGIIQPTTIKGITQIPQPGNTNIQKNPLGLEIDKLKQDQQEKIRKLKEQQPASKEPAQRQGHTQQDIHDNKIDDDSETVPGEKIGKKDKITE